MTDEQLAVLTSVRKKLIETKARVMEVSTPYRQVIGDWLFSNTAVPAEQNQPSVSRPHGAFCNMDGCWLVEDSTLDRDVLVVRE
jgi:hypothetical protein